MTFVSQRIGAEALNDINGWANRAVPLMVVEVLVQIRSFRKNPHRSSWPSTGPTTAESSWPDS